MTDKSTALSEEQAQAFLQATGVGTPPKPPETTFEEDEKNPDLATTDELPCEKSEALCEIVTSVKRRAVEILNGTVYIHKIQALYSEAEMVFLLEQAGKLNMNINDYVKYVSLNSIMHPIVPSPPKHLEK